MEMRNDGNGEGVVWAGLVKSVVAVRSFGTRFSFRRRHRPN